MEKVCGDFKLSIYTDGYPKVIYIKKHFNDAVYSEIRLTHKEIKDLKYLIDIAETECNNTIKV